MSKLPPLFLHFLLIIAITISIAFGYVLGQGNFFTNKSNAATPPKDSVGNVPPLLPSGNAQKIDGVKLTMEDVISGVITAVQKDNNNVVLTIQGNSSRGRTPPIMEDKGTKSVTSPTVAPTTAMMNYVVKASSQTSVTRLPIVNIQAPLQAPLPPLNGTPVMVKDIAALPTLPPPQKATINDLKVGMLVSVRVNSKQEAVTIDIFPLQAQPKK